MSDAVRLREQGRKARRLAAGVSDRMSQDALNHYAKECEEQAAKLEARAALEDYERKREG